MPDDLWLWLGRASALLSMAVVGTLLVPALISPGYFRRHYFFLFYLTITCIYLQVAPMLAQLGEPPAIVLVYRMARVQDLRPEYGWLQVGSLLLFQLPLVMAYLAYGRQRLAGASIGTHPAGARLCAVLMGGFAAAFVAVVVRHQFWYIRLGDALTERLMELPPLEFAVFRLFQECGLFVVGLTLIAWRYSEGRTRQWCQVSFLVVTATFGAFNLLNSRWFVTSLLVCLVGWFVAASPVPTRRQHVTRLAMVAVVGLLAAYLSVVVVNVRNATSGVGLATLSPVAGMFADTQGINRLDCIDLMARLKQPLEREGPAYLRSWGQVTWIVWRFVDPEGFDSYRLSRQTTAKSYLMREYLGVIASDYFSCTVTDLYGNFNVAGFLIGAVVLGLLFAWTTQTLVAPRSGMALTLAIFVLAQVVIFDQEAVFTLFGWIRKLPVLAVALAARPFTVGKAS